MWEAFAPCELGNDSGNELESFGIEFERTFKSAGRLEELRPVFNAERGVDTFLFLTPNSEILYLLAVELNDVRKRIGFALSKTFQADVLEADILSNSSAGEVISFREFLLGQVVLDEYHSHRIVPLI